MQHVVASGETDEQIDAAVQEAAGKLHAIAREIERPGMKVIVHVQVGVCSARDQLPGGQRRRIIDCNELPWGRLVAANGGGKYDLRDGQDCKSPFSDNQSRREGLNPNLFVLNHQLQICPSDLLNGGL